MYEKLLDEMTGQWQQFLGPISSVNKALLQNAEKVTQFQLEALEAYTEIGVQNMKAAIAVKDPESLQQFANRQVELAQELQQKATEDANALVALANELKDELQKLGKDLPAVSLVPAAPKTAASAPKKARKTA